MGKIVNWSAILADAGVGAGNLSVAKMNAGKLAKKVKAEYENGMGDSDAFLAATENYEAEDNVSKNKDGIRKVRALIKAGKFADNWFIPNESAKTAVSPFVYKKVVGAVLEAHPELKDEVDGLIARFEAEAAAKKAE